MQPHARRLRSGAFSQLTLIALSSLGSLSGCGGDPNILTADGRGGSWNIFASSTNISLARGGTATVTLTIQGSPKGAVTVSLGTPPDSVTATLSSPSISVSSPSTVTFNTAIHGPTGTIPFSITAKDASGDLSALSVNLILNPAPSVTVTRGGSGSGTVTSVPAGINCGGACTLQVAGGTSVTLTAAPATGSGFASWAGACVGTALTCTFVPANPFNSVSATFNSTAPAIALSAAPSPLTVQAGGSSAATVTVTRINDFAGAVSFNATAPSGITATPSSGSITGTTATLTIAAAASLGAGNYPITITGSGTGVTQQSVTLPVQVPLGPSGAITFNYAPCDPAQIPVWFAVQNGSGTWTRITPVNNAFTFTIGATGAYAFVTPDGSGFGTSVTFASAAEIAAIAAGNPCGAGPATGSKHLSGTIGNAGDVTQGIFATVIMGGASYTRKDNTIQTFTFTNAPGGRRDLIAARIQSLASVSRMIVRRNTNYANNAIVPTLDLGVSAESFIPPLGNVAPTNFGSDIVSLNASLLTANGPSVPYYSFTPTASANFLRYPALPDTLLQPGDFHSLEVFATPVSGTTFRLAELLLHSPNTVPATSTTPPTATPIAFGPVVSGAGVSTLGSAPYLRLRATVASQSVYTAGAHVDIGQANRSVSMSMTSAYLSTAPSTWTLDVPDFSSAGYDPTWALASGSSTSWSVVAVSGNVLPFIGGNPVDNAQIIGAGMQNSSASFSIASRGLIMRIVHR